MALAQGNKITYLPSPVRGINLVDPLFNMNDGFCLDSINVKPEEGFTQCRDGMTALGSSATPDGNYATLMSLNSSSAGVSFLMVDNSRNAYSISSTGTFSASLGASAPIYWCEFRNRIFISEATRTPKDWDGTTYATTAWTIGGAPTTALNIPWVYRGRLCFTSTNSSSTDVYFTTTLGAITGALSLLPTASWWTLGGSCAIGGAFCAIAGDVSSEMCAFISTRGEVFVWTGADPASSDWALVGKYFISPPLNEASYFFYGGDLNVITTQGTVSMREVIGGRAEASQYSSLTRNIDPGLQSINPVTNIPGVSLRATTSPKENLLYIFCSTTTPAGATQIGYYVMNLLTKAWGYYFCPTGFTAASNPVSTPTALYILAYKNSNLDMYLFRAGDIDQKYDSADAGQIDISWNLKHAFTNNSQLTNKKYNKIRPFVNNGLTLTIGSYVDFDTTLASQSVATSLSMNKRFYDINREATFISIYLAGVSNDSGATGLPEYHGSLLSYELGSNIP